MLAGIWTSKTSDGKDGKACSFEFSVHVQHVCSSASQVSRHRRLIQTMAAHYVASHPTDNANPVFMLCVGRLMAEGFLHLLCAINRYNFIPGEYHANPAR